jgi:hypothetical protein
MDHEEDDDGKPKQGTFDGNRDKREVPVKKTDDTQSPDRPGNVESSKESGDQPRFDPERFRLSQDFGAELGVKKRLVSVPVRKPDRQVFIRTHPDEGYRLPTPVIELKEDRETYLVDRTLWGDLAGEVTPKMIFTATTRQGVLFLWPSRLPSEDGRLDEWNRSALEAARIAMVRWVRVVANLSLGAYEVLEATGLFPEPEWPDTPFEELLRIAFKDHFIDRLDHPAIRRLRGQI